MKGQALRRADGILFNYETTGKTDYRHGQIKPSVVTKCKEKGRGERGSKFPENRSSLLKNTNTLSEWKTPDVPFTLFWKKKGIIREHPAERQIPYELPKDAGHGEAIRTRPRLVISPAVCVDDIEDPRTRTILCDDMYTSTMIRAARESAAPYFSVKAPLPDLPASANPIKLRKLLPPMVSPEWRKETVEWENKQLRGYCNYKSDFWLGRELTRCVACEATATVAAHRKMKTQVANRP